MKTETLEIVAEDLRRRVNVDDDPEGWQYGPDQSYTEADVIELLQEKEDTAISMLPEGYRRICRSTDYHGEVLTRRAKEGQKTLTPGLLPLVQGTLKVYVNFPQGAPWISDERDYYALEDKDFSVNWETGTITIPTLTKDDRVYVTYDHRAAVRLRMLKRLALDLAVVQIARDGHWDTDNYDVYKDLELNVYSTFKKMKERGDARLGIDMFDRLKLVKPLRDAGTVISW